jgi:hypothetical protein
LTPNDGPSVTVPPRPTPVAPDSPPAPAAAGRSQISAMQALAYFVGLHPTLVALDFTITRGGTIVSRVADDVTSNEAAAILGEYGTALATAAGETFRARRLQTGPWEWTELHARLPTRASELDAPTVPISIAGRRWAVPNPYGAVGGLPSPAGPAHLPEPSEPWR